jgi:hypothetical protein
MITPEYYGYYLRSEEWKEKRITIQEFCDSICMECQGRPGEILHHETYENIFEEPIDDLKWVCKPCHEKIHRSGRVLVPWYAKRKNKSDIEYLT